MEEIDELEHDLNEHRNEIDERLKELEVKRQQVAEKEAAAETGGWFKTEHADADEEN